MALEMDQNGNPIIAVEPENETCYYHKEIPIFILGGNLVRRFLISFIILCSGIIFFFQNCARPTPRSTGSGDSFASESPTTLDYTPGLSSDEMDRDTLGSLPVPPVFSLVQNSGTNQDERAYGLVQTSDGGYITTGLIQQTPGENIGRDILFKKFKKNGDHAYTVRVGDTFEQTGYKTIETSDAYLIAGTTRSVVEDGENRNADIVLVRLNKSDGRILDAFRYGTAADEVIHDIVQATDGSGESGFVAVGFRYHYNSNFKSALILKFNRNLEPIWQRRLSKGTENLTLQSVAYVPGKGYYAVGFRERANRDALIVHFSWSGELQQALISNNIDFQDDFRDVAHTGKDIVAVGRMNGNGFDGEGAIIRFNYNLSPTTTEIVGRDGTLETFMDVNTYPDESLILSGLTNATDSGQPDHFVIKLSKESEIEYLRIFGSEQPDTHQFHPLIVRKDFGLALMANNDNSSRVLAGNVRTLSPILYLIDQYGDFPNNCVSDSFGPPTNKDNIFTHRFNTKFVMQPVALTSSELAMVREDLSDFDSKEITPGHSFRCE